MLAAGGPAKWPANVPWPLHQAVAEHAQDLGLREQPVPAPGTGWCVPGLDEAVLQVARGGALTLVEADLTSWWVRKEMAPVAARRDLLRCDADVARVTYLAARRWAALTATSSKTLRRALASVGTRSRSAIPIRRHFSVPFV